MHRDVQPHLLVMTATIKPPADVIASDRNDPALRLNDYAWALKFYLSDQCRLVDRIVFIDNSLADLSPLEALVKKQGGSKEVEFLSFHGLDYPANYTKGYGEFKLLDHGATHSRLLSELRGDDKWWKVTGRYRAVNLDKLIRTAPRSYDLYADFRWRKQRVDVRLLSFSRNGYERLFLGRYPEMSGIQLEDYFFHRFAPLLKGQGGPAAGIIPEFHHVPRIEGIGGFQNVDYMTGKYKVIYHVRSTLQFFRNLFRPRQWERAASPKAPGSNSA